MSSRNVTRCVSVKDKRRCVISLTSQLSQRRITSVYPDAKRTVKTCRPEQDGLGVKRTRQHAEGAFLSCHVAEDDVSLSVAQGTSFSRNREDT